MLSTDRLAHIATGIFEAAPVPFAGSGSWGLLAAADKIVAKEELGLIGIAVPGYAEGPGWAGVEEGRRYIVKAVTEHASLGIDEGAVVTGPEGVRARAAQQDTKYFGVRLFAEEYIDGREFNIAILDTVDGPRVMPLAEMTFTGFAPGKPKIVDYNAKWKPGTPEYDGTVRVFLDEAKEPVLAARLKETALKVWHRFRLGGWARVDMRIAPGDVPYVIDINVNPEISDEGGMAAAALQAGISYPDLIDAIVQAGLRRGVSP
jgi:D-alanine-D-alanine ligase